ncbi:MAG: tRNA adenosine(34) deaminase TadA [Janthinobacterium lividum]
MTDADWMGIALDAAREAGERGEVPVGAVLVKDGVIVATGRNSPIASHDPTAHAEIDALRAGAAALGNYRLDGCTLYVTLEPCAMCAGAALHARLDRIVFGAAEPASGAAGSVIDLFAEPRLNHRTEIAGGVRALDCATLLQGFFRQRREASRLAARPLREDALRTPAKRFEGLPDYAFVSRWSSGLTSQRRWRMHYLDEGPPDGAATVLCLHAPGQWSYFFRRLVAQAGPRWLAPDLIGFGMSDKPKREDVHSLALHADVLLEWTDTLGVGRLAIAVAPGAGPLADLLLCRTPDRFVGALVVPDTADNGASAAWRAPFPDRGHEAALRALGVCSTKASGPSHAQCAQIARDAMGYFAP